MTYRNTIAVTVAATTVCLLAGLSAMAPFISRTINAFNDAFNDPSIVAYANEQGEFLPNSSTPSLPNPPAPAKSLSQSTRSSNY
jgi:hypothetical protein